MKVFLIIIKLLILFACGLGATIFIPFTTSNGLDFVKAHGKLLLWIIGFVNAFLAGSVSGGFLEPEFKTGFSYWSKPLFKGGGINPTIGFGILFFAWNIFVLTAGVEA